MIVILVVIVVWVLIIYQTWRRAAKRRAVWKVEGENLQTLTTGLPLLGEQEMKGRNGEERPDLEEVAIRNILSADE